MNDNPNHMQRIATALEQLLPVFERVADALDPTPPDVVGTRYIADRLGCTTVWVADLVRQGVIPASCVVRGTGNGCLWKFYRTKIDEWFAKRDVALEGLTDPNN